MDPIVLASTYENGFQEVGTVYKDKTVLIVILIVFALMILIACLVHHYLK